MVAVIKDNVLYIPYSDDGTQIKKGGLKFECPAFSVIPLFIVPIESRISLSVSDQHCGVVRSVAGFRYDGLNIE